MIEGFFSGVLIVLIPMLLSSWFPYFVVLMIGSFIIKLKLPVIKGVFGEWIVNRKLGKLGPEYKIYHDLYIPNDEYGLTQVDHIVISPYGIFVIETKNYTGWIFGDEYKPYWTQVIYKRKEKFYNPIRQNYGHIQALKSVLNKEHLEIHSIIAFSSSSTFKFTNEFTTASVIHFSQLKSTIKAHIHKQINTEELQEIEQAITSLLIVDKKKKRSIKKEHIQNLKNKHKKKVVPVQAVPKESSCPKCNGKLSKRKGRYGAFYGCSNYPTCTFTRKVG